MQANQDTQMVIEKLQEAEQIYHATAHQNQEAQLTHALQCYQKALQLYEDNLSPEQQMQVQPLVERVQARMAAASSELLQPDTTKTAMRTASLRPRKRATLVLSILIPTLLFVGISGWLLSDVIEAAPTPLCVNGTLHIDGSTALQPLVAQAAQDYKHGCPAASIAVASPGSASLNGLTSVEAGTNQIGDSDIFALPAQHDLVDHQVAAVIFTLIVNKQVGATIHGLTTEQIRGIYTGEYKNWSELHGPDLNIVPLSRTPGSGTRYTFQRYILKGVQTILGTQAPADSSTMALQQVDQTPGAISYTTVNKAIHDPNVTMLSIDNIPPTNAAVEAKQYQFWNIEHMYTKGPATPLEQAFLNFLTKDFSTQLSQFPGYLALSNVSSAIQQRNQDEATP